MSKAEQRALEAYPKDIEEYIDVKGVRSVVDNNSWQRTIFLKGYHQAEQDLTDKAKVSSGWDGFYYGQGYKQAEKDLLENEHEKSWRLDEKLWKGIKDIEEASYQYMYDASNDWAYDVPTWKDVQDAFKAGSEWKEDLELSWKDIEKIDDISLRLDCTEEAKGMSNKEFYQEVLKQFKERKNK